MVTAMLRRLRSLPSRATHYVAGSAYLVAHLLTHEQRARRLRRSRG
jgi:hypothetical protein